MGSFGNEILWSVNLPSEGPDGIEFGRVNTRVMTAKTAIVPSRTAIRRGGIAGTGRPNRLRCTGILKDSKVADECELITDAQSVKTASRRRNYGACSRFWRCSLTVGILLFVTRGCRCGTRRVLTPYTPYQLEGKRIELERDRYIVAGQTDND